MAPNDPHVDSDTLAAPAATDGGEVVDLADLSETANTTGNDGGSRRTADMEYVRQILQRIAIAREKAETALALYEVARLGIDQASALCKATLSALKELRSFPRD